MSAGRYAPSPSGRLHLGNLRTALVAWLAARSLGLSFVVRIDNLDRDRDAGYGAAQLDDLRRLGLDWDGEIVWQAERTAAYDAALEQLTAQGLVYECVCSRRDILAAPTAPHAPPGAYPGTCRGLSAAELAAATERIWPRQPALRLNSDAALAGQSTHSYRDLLLGEVTASVDDFVLRRGDGTHAYNLATVVDDAASGITQVVRGADLASSTPRQLLLYKLLHLPAPVHAHVPLVVNAAGERLAKRDGAVTLPELTAAGVSDSAVFRLLATSLMLPNSHSANTPNELLYGFDLAHINRNPWVFDAARLTVS